MAYPLLLASDAHWRPSNLLGVLNTDLAKHLGAETLAARLWRPAPGQASTRHRHPPRRSCTSCSRGPGGSASTGTS